MRRVRIGLCGVLLALLPAAPCAAGVSVAFDRETLNELLPALTVDRLELPLTGDQGLEVLLEDLQVTGFDPAGAESSSGHILGSLRLRVPTLGLTVPMEPRLSLHVVPRAQGDELEMRFDSVRVRLPLVGNVDLAPLLQPLRFPAENLFFVNGNRGDVEVRSRLTDVRMGQKLLRLEFDLETVHGP